MLTFKNVCASYTNVEINDVSFKVAKEDFFTLFGPDDSGKTELIEMLMGIRKCHKGQILYNDIELSKLTFHDRKKIRYVPDDIIIANNITGNAYLRKVLKMYKMDWSLELEELIERFHIDISKCLGEMTYEENKIISVLAAVVTNPELLILDEPSNFLTQEGEKKVYQLIDQKHQEGCTIIVLAEHFEEVIEYSNAFAYLKEGEILLTSHRKGLYDQYKAVTIQKGQWSSLESEFGQPIAVSEKGKTYLYCEDMGGLADIFYKCRVEDNGLFIENISMEELIERDYSRWN